MSNTVITNYTDLNGPSTKADSSVVVIVNKDGSLSVDQNLLGTLMGSDGSQAAGISVVRVGHEGRPDDATDSETEDDKVPHVTLSVDSYYDEPNSIIKYDSGAEMLQSLRIETRENSLLGFQNDHCYTSLTSPSQTLPQKNDNYTPYDEPKIEISHTPPPKPVPFSKKITILDQQIITKGKKILINPSEAVILKGNDILNKPLAQVSKVKNSAELEKNTEKKTEESVESSSISSSGDSIPDRDSDSDYKDTRDRTGPIKLKRGKLKPRILKSLHPTKITKLDSKVPSRLKANKNLLKKDLKDKSIAKAVTEKKTADVDIESLIPTSEISVTPAVHSELNKSVPKTTPKSVKKDKKTPAHVTALLSDMTSLFSTPDVIRRVSTDNKGPSKPEKESVSSEKKLPVATTPKTVEASDGKVVENKAVDNVEKLRPPGLHKTYLKQKDKIINPAEKITKPYELIPQLDDASLAQILQDSTTAASNPVKVQSSISANNTMNSPGLAGPLSPTLDLLGGLQPEEEGLTEDLLMHVAQLVESSENLQEVIDKQVLGKVDNAPAKATVQSSFQQAQVHAASNVYAQSPKSVKTIVLRKDPIEIVRRDGRVITLPPIEAPATRASKRKSQMDTTSNADVLSTPTPVTVQPVSTTPEPHLQTVSKHYVNKKLVNKKEQVTQATVVDKISAESQESWNSEDDPYRLWCICKQPHNNRFMICCDGCEDWFHGKCVNITKAMGQQMEEQGIEWRCPNCIKKTKPSPKTSNKVIVQKKTEVEGAITTPSPVSKEAASRTSCIVCKKPARASSIYCSDACILKHAQDSLVNQPTSNKSEGDSGKSQEKQKSESRVIVYERKSGRLLAGPNAPTAENLKAWLQKNPTFEVVRPGTLSTIKPNISKKKVFNEPHKIQTTLNFERIPKKVEQSSSARIHQSEIKDKITKILPSPKEERVPKMLQSPREDRMPKVLQCPKEERTPKVLQSPKEEKMAKVLQSPKEDKTVKVLQSPKGDVKLPVQPKTPVTPKSQPPQFMDTPKASTSYAKTASESRKLVRATSSRSQSTYEKTPTVSPSISRRKDTSNKAKMDSVEEIRENVRKALQEQMTIRMAEHDGPKFTEDEILQFAFDTEDELNELFNKDVGMKYKAKYRSLMFNIKDRKNHSLWQKICDRTITPKQLVRLSPEELASQELAQWREDEVKHQLELIKKSEIDILAANKTYVLKTHKGEKVMENTESVSTELDPNVPVEDIVTALNDQTVGEVPPVEGTQETTSSKKETTDKKHSSRRKRGREESGVSHSKKRRNKESKRESERRKSRSSRKGSDNKETTDNEKSTRSSGRRSSRRISSAPKESSRVESKEKSDFRDRSRRVSRSREKSKKRSRSREHSRSKSQGRERSSSRARSRKRSTSRESSKRRRRSRSKHSNSTEEKHKHRSKSQENVSSKNKNDSTDSDSIERPKSAMLKEAHPEYDPHEPMITSAFSEEDLRKSREDVYEDTYKNDIDDYSNTDYDPAKSFAMNTEVVLDTPKSVKRQDRISEAESDQEPTSTVDNSSPIVWNGCINMVDVARFYVAAHEVSGSGTDLEDDITAELDIVGRINPDTVWEYIGKMKRASNKDILILKLQAANDEEKMQYIALYSYLSSRNRLGVVKVSNTTSVKDFYIVPLSANTSVPAVLLPLDGPGLGDIKTHLLIAIVIRQRKKRLGSHIPKDIIPAKVAREPRKRSYTPPVVGKISSYTPPTSPRRRVLPLPTYTSPALSSSVKDKIAASLASADDEEAYSPGSSSSSTGSAPTVASQQSQPNSNKLRCKMEELNRQIEEQKQQILKMAQADSSVGEDEAYSPSRPMTPPPVVPLADISLPSNLQEILATIKQRSETVSADVDMRLPMPP